MMGLTIDFSDSSDVGPLHDHPAGASGGLAPGLTPLFRCIDCRQPCLGGLQLPLYTLWATGTRKEQAFAVLHCTNLSGRATTSVQGKKVPVSDITHSAVEGWFRRNLHAVEVARQRAAQFLAEEIADRIRMAEPLALEDLRDYPPPMDT